MGSVYLYLLLQSGDKIRLYLGGYLLLHIEAPRPTGAGAPERRKRRRKKGRRLPEDRWYERRQDRIEEERRRREQALAIQEAIIERAARYAHLALAEELIDARIKAGREERDAKGEQRKRAFTALELLGTGGLSDIYPKRERQKRAAAERATDRLVQWDEQRDREDKLLKQRLMNLEKAKLAKEKKKKLEEEKRRKQLENLAKARAAKKRKKKRSK